ncbi:MAG: PAQR family membrane homeostasis protein TrhA [Ilumatobacteraceae bacterium]
MPLVDPPAGVPPHSASRSAALPLPDRPALRGWLHAVSFPVMTVLGLALVLRADVSAHGRLLLGVYVAGTCTMFGASALYHRVRWRARAKALMQRVDRSAIFLAIAGGYTPVAWVCLDGTTRTVVLASVWTGALVGISLNWLPHVHHAAKGASFIVVGWIAAAVLPRLAGELGTAGFALILFGGVSYTIGAICFATRRPNPWPRVFGFHEVFHAFTVVAAGLQFTGIAVAVVPRL